MYPISDSVAGNWQLLPRASRLSVSLSDLEPADLASTSYSARGFHGGPRCPPLDPLQWRATRILRAWLLIPSWFARSHSVVLLWSIGAADSSRRWAIYLYLFIDNGHGKGEVFWLLTKVYLKKTRANVCTLYLATLGSFPKYWADEVRLTAEGTHSPLTR